MWTMLVVGGGIAAYHEIMRNYNLGLEDGYLPAYIQGENAGYRRGYNVGSRWWNEFQRQRGIQSLDEFIHKPLDNEKE